MKYDVVVIGAGANGLAAAGVLAKAGRKVLVVEQRDRCGGLAAADEFAPGCLAPGPLHDTSLVRHSLLESLHLERHGLVLSESAPSVYVPQRRARGLLLHHDASVAAPEIAAFSERDAEAYSRFRGFIERVRGVVNRFLDAPPVDPAALDARGMLRSLPTALALRRLGRRTMMELLRVAPMAVADWLDEYFESDLLKTALAAPALHGSFVGPRSPGSAANLLLYECRRGAAVRGGAAALIAALETSVREAGVEVRTGERVRRIRVSDGRVEGLELSGGEAIESAAVAATCDPKQVFLKLLDPGSLGDTFARRIRQYRAAGTTAKVNIALNSPLELSDREGVEFMRTGSRLDDIERAFDAVKYGECSDVPVLDIHVTEGGAEGHTVLSVVASFAPYDHRRGWTVEEREVLGSRVVQAIDDVIPGTRDSLAHVEVLVPPDIEKRYALTGGHVLHGDHQLDQILSRPCPEAAQYETPIEQLFLCGGGTHPGGGLTCAPGALGARALLHSGR